MNLLNLYYSNQLITFQNHIISVIHSKFSKLNQLSDSIALTESEQILSSFIDFASELLFEASFGQDKIPHKNHQIHQKKNKGHIHHKSMNHLHRLKNKSHRHHLHCLCKNYLHLCQSKNIILLSKS